MKVFTLHVCTERCFFFLSPPERPKPTGKQNKTKISTSLNYSYSLQNLWLMSPHYKCSFPTCLSGISKLQMSFVEEGQQTRMRFSTEYLIFLRKKLVRGCYCYCRVLGEINFFCLLFYVDSVQVLVSRTQLKLNTFNINFLLISYMDKCRCTSSSGLLAMYLYLAPWLKALQS